MIVAGAGGGRKAAGTIIIIIRGRGWSELGRDCGRGLPHALAGGVDGGDGGAIEVSTAPIASPTRARVGGKSAGLRMLGRYLKVTWNWTRALAARCAAERRSWGRRVVRSGGGKL